MSRKKTYPRNPRQREKREGSYQHALLKLRDACVPYKVYPCKLFRVAVDVGRGASFSESRWMNTTAGLRGPPAAVPRLGIFCHEIHVNES